MHIPVAGARIHSRSSWSYSDWPRTLAREHWRKWAWRSVGRRCRRSGRAATLSRA